MKEEIDLENFCPWDWLQEKAKELLDEELKKAIEWRDNKNDT